MLIYGFWNKIWKRKFVFWLKQHEMLTWRFPIGGDRITFRGSKLTKSPSTLPWRSIWKRRNHQSFWICVGGKLGQGNHIIMVTPTLSRSKWKALAGFSNSSGLKSVSGKPRLPHRLECTVGPAVEPWSNGLACTCVELRSLLSRSNLHASRSNWVYHRLTTQPKSTQAEWREFAVVETYQQI